MSKNKAKNTLKKAESLPGKVESKKPLPEKPLKLLNKIKVTSAPGQKQIKYLAAILCFICIILYANTIGNDYAVDDGAAITKNKKVQQGISGIPTLLKTGFLYGMYGLTSSKFSYRPVSLISFAIEHSLWGDNPHISHVINILLFALTIVLLFYLLRKILPGKHRTIYAFVISALFAAHPIHTEVVAYIKSRDELFSFLSLLLSILNAIRYLETKKNLKLVIASLFFFLALMSKESAITFMAIIPFTLYYFFRPTKKQLLAISIAMAGSMVAYLLLRVSIFGDLIHSEEKFDITDNFMESLGFAARLPIAITIIFKYILKLIFPHPLSFDYSFNMIPAYNYGSWEFIVSLFICLALVAYAIYAFKKKNILAYAIIYFFISIAVVSNIAFVIGNAFAERFMYVPSLAFCIALGYGIMFLYKNNNENTGLFPFRGQPVPLLCLSGILILYSIKTITRNQDWKDNSTLYSHDIKYADKSARVHSLLGSIYKETGEKIVNNEPEKNKWFTMAENEWEASIKIYPDNKILKRDLMDLEINRGEIDKANAIMGAGNIVYDSVTAKAAYDIGVKFSADRNYPAAISKYKMALAVDPHFAIAYINLGLGYYNMHIYDSAIESFNKGLAINPKMAYGYIGMGLCYSSNKEYPKAAENYRKALELDPNSPESLSGLGNIYFANNNLDSAIIYLEKAHKLNPNDLNTINIIGVCYLKMNKYDLAIQYFKQLEAIDPNNPGTNYNLAYAYHMKGDDSKANEYRKKGDELKAKTNAGH